MDMYTEKWKEFCLKCETETKSLKLSDLILYEGDASIGMVGTFIDIKEGRVNTTGDPIEVIYIKEENKYLVIDGYHRVAQAINENKEDIMANIDWTGYTLKYTVPTIEERYVFEGLKSAWKNMQARRKISVQVKKADKGLTALIQLVQMLGYAYENDPEINQIKSVKKIVERGDKASRHMVVFLSAVKEMFSKEYRE